MNAIVSELGISQRELAERLGVSEGRVSQILSGSSGLTLSTLASFGWATGLRFDLVPRPAQAELGEQAAEQLDWLPRLRELALKATAAPEEDWSPRQRERSPAAHRFVSSRRVRTTQRRGVQAVPRNERHVVPSPEGGWDIKAPNAGRSSGHFDRQSDAIDRARQIVGNTGGGEVVIHNRDGRVRDSDTVPPGRDPFPPRDKK